MGGHAWGAVADAELLRAVQVALELDTADIYGLGRSEELLGHGIAGRRDEAVIATKGGVRRAGGKTTYDNSPQYLATALHGSLRRLAVDAIDLYQVHYWDEQTPLNAIFETLELFREAGKIRAYGVTNLDLAAQAVPSRPPALVSYSFEYSLAQRRHYAAIERNRQLRLVFLSWVSLGQGVLSGSTSRESAFSPDDRRRRPTYVNFHGERFARNLDIVDTMRGSAASLSWPLARECRPSLDSRYPSGVDRARRHQTARPNPGQLRRTWLVFGCV